MDGAFILTKEDIHMLQMALFFLDTDEEELPEKTRKKLLSTLLDLDKACTEENRYSLTVRIRG